MPKVMISAQHVSKTFQIPHERYNSLKGNVLHLLSPRRFSRFDAVKDVSFDVYEGEFFGIVGRNGCGKSTLLKMLAGIYTTSKGTISLHGSLSPFIELGVGFNPELTARENVYMNGAILGLSRKQIDAKFDEIIGFGELEEFVDQKLKNFSSGMQVRLAFSIAIQAEADIMLVDEVLAVGDANFQAKCFDVFRRLKKQGKTIVFVTHDMGAVRDFCDRAILIRDGGIIAEGDTESIINEYVQLNLEDANTKQVADSQDEVSGELKRWGNGKARIRKVVTQTGTETRAVFGPNQAIEVVYEIEAKEEIDNPVVGLIIKGPDGHALFATNTKLLKQKTGIWPKGSRQTLRCKVDNIFGNGVYTVSPAIATTDTREFYDWIEDAISFQVNGRVMAGGTVQPESEFEIG